MRSGKLLLEGMFEILGTNPEHVQVGSYKLAFVEHDYVAHILQNPFEPDLQNGGATYGNDMTEIGSVDLR